MSDVPAPSSCGDTADPLPVHLRLHALELVNGGTNASELRDNLNLAADRLAADTAERDRLHGELNDWRGWAQFCYLGGGKAEGSSDSLRRRVAEQHDADVAAIRAQLAHPWQPIETAPKDWTVILGWSAEWAMGRPEIIVWLNGNRVGWHTYAGHHLFVKLPTHWMPLPEPPT